MLKQTFVRAKTQKGATLVELMVSLAIGMVSVLGVASLVGMGVGVNSKLMNNSRLNEELKNVASLMARDIRRAGYNGASIDMVTDPDSSPSAFANSITVSQYSGEAANSCIEFAYDANGNGELDTSGTNENYGYRLRDGVIEMRSGGAVCTATGWEALTDADMVTVSSLTFTANTTVVNSVTSTQVTITLAGATVANSNQSRGYSTSFLVRSYD